MGMRFSIVAMFRVLAAAGALLLSTLGACARPATRSNISLIDRVPGTPQVFAPGTISTEDMELNATFMPDGRSVYYTKRTPKLQLWVIVVSHLRNGRWSEPQIASFSGQYSDFDPFISPDGSKLFFSSSRPVDSRPKRDFDIWVVERSGDAWSGPRHLDAPVNTPAQEFYPTVAANGTLYFSSNRDGGRGALDIYRSRLIDGRYAEPESLGDSVNSERSDGDPYIAPDESYLLFVSYGRADGRGDGDLYVSRRGAAGWREARNLGPEINSSALDFCPIVSPDQQLLYFTSERGFADSLLTRPLSWSEMSQRLHHWGNGLGDIYSVDLRTVLASP
jgi:hypothetical protein